MAVCRQASQAGLSIGAPGHHHHIFLPTCRACRRRRVLSTSSRRAATSLSRAARSAVSCFSWVALLATVLCSRSSCLQGEAAGPSCELQQTSRHNLRHSTA